nr:MAG TPA: hypothetical protein [Bacteriophage sp.]
MQNVYYIITISAAKSLRFSQRYINVIKSVYKSYTDCCQSVA